MTTKVSFAAKSYILAFGLFVAAVVVFGVSLIRNPSEMRIVKIDERRVSDLVRISRSVEAYKKTESRLPESLDSLVDGNRQYVSLNDPETNARYGYRVIDALTFEVCATFSTSNLGSTNVGYVYIDGVN